MKKKIVIMSLFMNCYADATVSTVMNRHVVTSSPLLYKTIDYSDKQLSIQVEPWGGALFDADHLMKNITPTGTSSLILDQQGQGDINPEWILLGNTAADYHSQVTLNPHLSTVGLLFDLYKQFDRFYFDIKTSLIRCKTSLDLSELGGGDGGISSAENQVITDAALAFTQDGWNFGKIGESNSIVGLDNIQIILGTTVDMDSCNNEYYDFYFSAFGLLEAPTGSGTKSEWLFEPQVGTNHWGLGFGADGLIQADKDWSIIVGGNYRYLFGAREVRSFDLVDNGPWSRYLGIELIANDELSVGLPGINIFTQEALVQGRSQVNGYARLQKLFHNCLCELSYNFLYTQAETISDVVTMTPGYGVFDMTSKLGGSGITSSTAQINQSTPLQDPAAVELSVSDLDLVSAGASSWSSSMVAARLQYTQSEKYCYGIGASADFAHSAQAISTWSVWANFELLL